MLIILVKMEVHTFIVNYFIDLFISQYGNQVKCDISVLPFVARGEQHQWLFNLCVRCYKTFFLCTVGENSPLLYKRITYTMYAADENLPMTY